MYTPDDILKSQFPLSICLCFSQDLLVIEIQSRSQLAIVLGTGSSLGCINVSQAFAACVLNFEFDVSGTNSMFTGLSKLSKSPLLISVTCQE